MAKIKWTDDMSVGVGSIDNQHKVLIAAINEFYQSLDGSVNKDLISDLLTKMKDYSVFHFEFEEELLRRHAYPDFGNHSKEHKNFISKVEDIDKRLKEGKLVLSLELTSFIKEWLTNHIMIVDKKYTSFLNSKGVY